MEPGYYVNLAGYMVQVVRLEGKLYFRYMHESVLREIKERPSSYKRLETM